ncbi:hypothetical protein FOWG_17801 [Fusarium oxysporum f. sp. lycopersici MN25]|nr:hypothetical protein FOWG_17801 [Fusarium oxysporum f. sp. lycopersici MN25]
MGEVLNLKQFYQASAPLSTSESEAFIQTIWRPSRELDMFTLSSYFEFLETERKRESRVDNRAYSQLCFKHVFDVHCIIYENSDKPRPDLQALVQNRLSPFNLEPEVLEDVIILVIRLVFMVRIEFQNPSHPSPFQLQMQVTQSFQETLRTLQIGPPLREWSMQHELPSWFNVIDLKRKANVRVGWTDYLNEHLTYQSGTLMLFRHIEVLKYMEASAILGNFFSLEFLRETQRSLLLFFPVIEGKYDSQDYLDWLQNRWPIEEWQGSLTGHDPNSHISRFYKDFPTWHHNLSCLLSISNNQQSWNIQRLWYDDRDQTLWWTRWCSVTVIFLFILFGLIKSIMDILLVGIAAHS